MSKTAQRLEIGVQRFAVLMAEEELKSLDAEKETLKDPQASEMTEN